MADTLTPNYQFIQPEDQGSKDSWGAKWNDNFDKIDGILSGLAHTPQTLLSLPKGAIIYWNNANPPTGWALCNGQPNTPDLRNRFIIGAGRNFFINTFIFNAGMSNSGGHTHTLTPLTDTHNHGGVAGDTTLTLSQFPSHNHGGGSHVHSNIKGETVSVDNSGYNGYTVANGGQGTNPWGLSPSALIGYAGTPNPSPHHHNVNAADGAHTHVVNAIGDHTHTYTPPYYTLVMIIKL